MSEPPGKLSYTYICSFLDAFPMQVITDLLSSIPCANQQIFISFLFYIQQCVCVISLPHLTHLFSLCTDRCVLDNDSIYCECKQKMIKVMSILPVVPLLQEISKGLCLCYICFCCCCCCSINSFMSDSSRPCRLQPARFLHPWDFPGKNTEVAQHFLLRGSLQTRDQT